MNLRHIEVFYALMRSSSMTEAARRLNVSQPAISTVLKHAEQRLGMQLFQRAGGRLLPTPEAIALLPDVEQIFTRLESLGRAAQGLRDASSGVLSIAASPTLANVLLAPAVAAFARERPEVRVLLKALPTAQVAASLRDRACDLGLVYEPAGGVEEDMSAEPVGSFHVACVLPREHPLAARPVLGPAELQGQRLICFGPATPLGARLAEAFRAAGQPFVVNIESSSSASTLFLVAAGAGIGLVDSAGALGGAFPALLQRDFAPRIESRLLLLQARDRPRSRLAAAFARRLLQTVQGGAATPTRGGTVACVRSSAVTPVRSGATRLKAVAGGR